MLKSIKKGEVIIYVIALMLVAAGYLNYTSNENNNTVETYSENIANIGDAVLVSNNDVNDIQDNTTNSNKTEETNAQSEEKEDENNNNNNIDNSQIAPNEENKETSAEIKENKNEDNKDSDYFTASKLERDTMYANMISSYTAIIQNNNIDDTQKSIANQEIAKINNNKNAIMICENLLTTKGFNKCVMFINNSSINVVVGNEEELSKEKVAQIQNVVSRELNAKIENIHISQNNN